MALGSLKSARGRIADGDEVSRRTGRSRESERREKRRAFDEISSHGWLLAIDLARYCAAKPTTGKNEQSSVSLAFLYFLYSM